MKANKVLGFIAMALVFGVTNLGLSGCAKNEGDVVDCCCPPATRILLQPMGNFTTAEANRLKEDLIKNLPKEDEDYIIDVDVLPAMPLTKDMLNDALTRYRASKILDAVKPKVKDGATIIAVLHEDISHPLHGSPDFGIQGLSYTGKDVGVVSTFRVHNRKDMWKVVYHEFCHACYGLSHCPDNDPSCILQDANGKPNWAPKRRLCQNCTLKSFENLSKKLEH